MGTKRPNECRRTPADFFMTVRVVGSVSSPNEGIAAYSVLTARCRARPFRRRNADAKLLRPWQPKLRVAERIPATVARMRNVTSGHSTSRKSRLVSKRSGYWRRADVLTTNSCQPSALSVNHVNLIFDPVRLARSRAAAPRIAFCDQEGPAIAPRYLTAAIASGAAVLSVDHEQKKFSGILRKCVRGSHAVRA